MMLKISSNKKFNPTLRLFGFTVKQNMGIVILTVICMLLVCPGLIAIHTEKTLEAIGNLSYEFNETLLIFGICASIASAVGVVVYNIINFMYLYSKKSSDVFHAIPLTRTQLLLSRGLAGIVCTLIPLVVGYLALIFITFLYPRLIVDLEILAVCFFYNILIMLVTWAISLVFIICAGTVFDFVLSFGVINIALLILPAIILTEASEMLFGYSGNNAESVVKWFSPIYFCGVSMLDFGYRAETYKIGATMSREPLWSLNETVMLTVSLLLIVGMTLLAAFLYNRRNAERAGNAYAFKFIYVAANLLFAFEVAYGLGLVFSDFEFGVVFWIFAVIGALLAAVIFGAVCERGFKTVKKSLIIGAGSTAALVAVFVIMGTGGFGFEKRVPETTDVADVTVDIEGIEVELTKDIDLVTKLHKKIVEGYSDVMHSMETAQEDYNVMYMQIEYTLKNGSKMYRSYYSLPSPVYGEELLEICKKQDIASHITLAKADKPRYVYFDGYLDDGIDETDDYIGFNISREEYIRLLEIYEREHQKLTVGILEDYERYARYYSWWESDLADTHFDFIVGDNYTEFLNEVKALVAKYNTEEAETQLID